MNGEQQRLLNKMKQLIRKNRCRFAQERGDRNYLDDLADFGIDEDEAWKIILSLNCNFFFPDPMPIFSRNLETLIFKRPIHGIIAYIKLTINRDEDGELVVCLSFHYDWKKVK